MSLQNKIDPFGTIHAVSMRGLFMGNRGGRFHDPATKTLLPGKTHVSRQWITCVTEFKDRKREVMGPGSYTELFFLDEVVSLAAGHRPCAECRRADFKRYCAAVSQNGKVVKASDLDWQLHGERKGLRQKVSVETLAGLPDGVMFANGTDAYAKRGNFALAFSFEGYNEKLPLAELLAYDVHMLTPPTSIGALDKGYKPVWHPTADT